MSVAGIPAGYEQVDLGAGFSNWFGPVYQLKGSPRLGFRVAPHHLNPVGRCHGGALSTFADMQIAALRDELGTSPGHAPTISLDMDYLASARLEQWVEMAVTLVKRTRSLLFTQALLSVDGEPVARSSALYRLFETAQ